MSSCDMDKYDLRHMPLVVTAHNYNNRHGMTEFLRPSIYIPLFKRLILRCWIALWKSSISERVIGKERFFCKNAFFSWLLSKASFCIAYSCVKSWKYSKNIECHFSYLLWFFTKGQGVVFDFIETEYLFKLPKDHQAYWKAISMEGVNKVGKL